MLISDPYTILVSPRPASDYRWGYLQFPRLGYTADGKILLTVSNDLDAAYISRATGAVPAFLSSDGGRTFADITGDPDLEQKKLRRIPVGGRFAEFPLQSAQAVSAAPLVLDKNTPYGGREKAPRYAVYAAADLPKELSSLCVRIGGREALAPLEGLEYLVAPDSEFDYVNARRIPLKRRVQPVNPSKNTFYTGLTDPFCVLQDRVLFALAEPVPDPDPLLRARISVFESADGCLSFRKIGQILPSTPLGLCGEFSLRPFGGRLHLIARTRLSHDMSFPHALAHYVSSDGGRSWSQSSPLSQCSVTPWLLTGQHEMLALYGRPGIYVKATSDGNTWSDSISLLGPDERTLPDPFPQSDWDAVHHKYSCCNLSVLPLSPGRYLLAYSDFRYPVSADLHKAILVRTLTCS